MSIKALREKIANFSKLANHLVAEKGSASWSAEEQATFDGYATEINNSKAAIKNIEAMRELDADKFFADVANVAGQKDPEKLNAFEAMALYMRFGNNVSAEQAVQIRNAMSTTTTTEGGYTVPSEIAAMVISDCSNVWFN